MSRLNMLKKSHHHRNAPCTFQCQWHDPIKTKKFHTRKLKKKQKKIRHAKIVMLIFTRLLYVFICQMTSLEILTKWNCLLKITKITLDVTQNFPFQHYHQNNFLDHFRLMFFLFILYFVFAFFQKCLWKIIFTFLENRINHYSVCNFQSMKSPMEHNSFLSKLFCYIIWFVILPDQTQHWMTCKQGLYVKSFCFFETIAQRFKNYKQLVV